MFFVYIIYSKSYDQFYIGQTQKFVKRLDRHNAGFVPSTKRYRPWILVLTIPKKTRSEAMVFERKIKNLSRTRLIAFIEKYG